MDYETIASALRCGRQNCQCKHGKLTHCPVTASHTNGDHMPSLSLNSVNGKILVRCHKGCTQESVLSAMTSRGLWATAQPRATGWQLVKSYEYRTADGVLVAEHGRFLTENGKAFAWRVPDRSWRDGLGNLTMKELPLYRLHDMLKSSSAIWLVEGEKAADSCAEHGLLAVCLGGGSSQKSFGNSLDLLRDREVILWPDNDDAGRSLMDRLSEMLPNAKFVRPVLPLKGDAYDYFEGGGSVGGLHELIETSLVGSRIEEEHWLKKYEGMFG